MSEINSICPCCGSDCWSDEKQNPINTAYRCPECGLFTISDKLQDISIKTYSVMHVFLLNRKNRFNKTIFFHLEGADCINDEKTECVAVESLEHLYPHTISERVDMILMNLSERIKVIGDEFVIPGPGDKMKRLYPLFFVDDSHGSNKLSQQIYSTKEIMKECGIIKHTNTLGDNENAYTFTADGWNRLIALQSETKVIAQAFIAMSFAPEMSSARVHIQRAISDHGYIPVVIDEKEYNGQIVPEMLYEIRRSKFVVADLTLHRNGVYYEAGYAQASGKAVIYTCKGTDFSDKHFDIAQENIIKWVTEQELYEKLLRRIESTIGKR